MEEGSALAYSDLLILSTVILQLSKLHLWFEKSIWSEGCILRLKGSGGPTDLGSTRVGCLGAHRLLPQHCMTLLVERSGVAPLEWGGSMFSARKQGAISFPFPFLSSMNNMFTCIYINTRAKLIITITKETRIFWWIVVDQCCTLLL